MGSLPLHNTREDHQVIPNTLPPLYPQGLEHDACGIAFLADLRRQGSHKLIQMGLGALVNLEHRGAKVRIPIPEMEQEFLFKPGWVLEART